MKVIVISSLDGDLLEVAYAPVKEENLKAELEKMHATQDLIGEVFEITTLKRMWEKYEDELRS